MNPRTSAATGRGPAEPPTGRASLCLRALVQGREGISGRKRHCSALVITDAAGGSPVHVVPTQCEAESIATTNLAGAASVPSEAGSGIQVRLLEEPRPQNSLQKKTRRLGYGLQSLPSILLPSINGGNAPVSRWMRGKKPHKSVMTGQNAPLPSHLCTISQGAGDQGVYLPLLVC